MLEDLRPLTADDVLVGPDGTLSVSVRAYAELRVIALERGASRAACFEDLQAAEAVPEAGS